MRPDKLMVWFCVVGLFALTAIIVSVVAMQRISQGANSRHHNLLVIKQTDAVFYDLVEAERRQERFLITGKAQDLDAYRGSLQSLDASLAELGSLSASKADEQARFRALAALAKERVANLETAVAGRIADGAEPVSGALASGGRTIMDTIRKQIVSGNSEEALALRDEDRRFQSGMRYLVAALSVGGIVILVLSGVAATSIRREMHRSLRVSRDAQNIIATVPESLLVLDARLHTQFSNAAFQEKFRCDETGVQHRSVFEILDGLFDKPALRDALGLLAEQGVPFQDIEFACELAHGGKHVLRMFGRRIALQVREQTQILLAIDDVTERRCMVAALEKSEAQLRDIFDGTSDLIQSVAPDGRIILVNRAWRETLEYDESEISGLNIFRIIHPDSLAHCRAVFEQLMQGELMPLVEVTFVSKSGKPVQLEGALTVGKSEDGHSFQTRGIFRDVTRRKQVEAALHASEAHFRQLTTTMPDGVLVIQQGRVVYANASSSQMLGCAGTQTLVGDEVSNFVDATELAHVLDLIDRALNNEAVALESRFRRNDGQVVPVEIAISSLSWEGEPAVQMVARDVSDRLSAAQAIALEKDRLELALSATRLSMWDADLSGDSIAFDERWSQIVGGEPTPRVYAFRELIGLVPEEERERVKTAAMNAITGKSAGYAEEHRVRDIHGELRWIHSRGRVVSRDKDGRALRMIGINWDVTERKRYEQNLVTARDAAEKANLAKDMFLATMSHEIRTPLNGMLGMLELLGHSKLDSHQSETLEFARDSGRSLVHIINDLLDHAKIEAGKLELSPEPVSIAQLLRRTQNVYSAQASAKNLLIRRVIDPQISPLLQADPQRILQVLGNLLSNAIKFTDQGYVELRAELLERSDDSETLRLSVKDSGIGIEKSAQDRLFLPYEQATADTARDHGGTGLGLAICRSLTQLMGGTIEIDSAPGSGTIISIVVEFPIAEPEAKPVEPATERPFAGKRKNYSRASGTQAQVLAVDDNAINRQLLARQLALLGVRVKTAANGAEALEYWKDHPVDLVVSDCNMPIMDGFELSTAIRDIEAREQRERTPIIAWTASALPEVASRCRAAGMDETLTKPATLSQLGALVDAWLPAACTNENAINFGAGVSGTLADAPIDLSGLGGAVTKPSERNEVLRSLNSQLRSDLDEMEAALASGDLAAAAETAHRMKGVSKMIGGHEMAGICESLELAATERNLDRARSGKLALVEAVRQIEAYVSDLIAAPPPDGADETAVSLDR